MEDKNKKKGKEKNKEQGQKIENSYKAYSDSKTCT